MAYIDGLWIWGMGFFRREGRLYKGLFEGRDVFGGVVAEGVILMLILFARKYVLN